MFICKSKPTSKTSEFCIIQENSIQVRGVRERVLRQEGLRRASEDPHGRAAVPVPAVWQMFWPGVSPQETHWQRPQRPGPPSPAPVWGWAPLTPAWPHHRQRGLGGRGGGGAETRLSGHGGRPGEIYQTKHPQQRPALVLQTPTCGNFWGQDSSIKGENDLWSRIWCHHQSSVHHLKSNSSGIFYIDTNSLN